MSLIVFELSLEMVQRIRPLIEQITRRDRALAGQLRRSASSVPLNIAEGAKSCGGNSLARFHNAAGSANETRAALQVAKAWGYIRESERQPVEALLDRICAMLWRLTHRAEKK